MHPRFHIHSFALLCIFSFSTLSLGDAKSLRGFSIIDLIDPDSPLSPSDDNNSLYSSKTFTFDLTASDFTYLMTIEVGPNGEKVTTQAIPDTGSDLIWLNGADCKSKVCEAQTAQFVKKPHTLPREKCPTECTGLKPGCSDPSESICTYKQRYGDGTTTTGELTMGKFWLHGEDKPVSIWFGVSTDTYCESEGDSSSTCMDKHSAGIVGLGHGEGKRSLIRQLVEHKAIKFKFSYCLPHHSNSPSKLIIGNGVQISDDKKSTPLVTNGCEGRYCVQLASVSLNGDETLKTEVSDENNIMIIDSGSSFTYLLPKLFEGFINHVKTVTGEESPTKIYHYDHCFKQLDGEKLKKVSLEFDRTTVELKQANFFDVLTHDNTGYLCLTVVGVGELNMKKNLLGSRAQIDFRVAFDMSAPQEKKVSFDADGCKQNVESLDFEA